MELSSSAKKVQDALLRQGVDLQVVELPASTRTSLEAAQAVGCEVGQIAKSLVFKRSQRGTPVLVIASGANRVDEARLEALMGEPPAKADADFVRLQTGFVIGGVPPLGHSQPLETYIDRDLLQYGEIWAAAGTPNAVFRLTPADLPRLTGGQVADVKRLA
jgi:prolyl-tRNA editing enzyme YbaK/EbsC (Cys-tRNA(Pro) deacylase)